MNFSLDDFFSLCYNEINILGYRMKLLLKNTRGCIMKKLAIVAFALVLAMTFVGCGVHDLRFVGTWDYVYSYDQGTGKPSQATRFEFTKDGVVKTYDISYKYVGDDVTFKKSANTPSEGTWLVINNDILEIEDLVPRYNKKWVVEFSSLNKKMKWTDKKDDKNVVNLEKATVTTEDAE